MKRENEKNMDEFLVTNLLAHERKYLTVEHLLVHMYNYLEEVGKLVANLLKTLRENNSRLF